MLESFKINNMAKICNKGIRDGKGGFAILLRGPFENKGFLNRAFIYYREFVSLCSKVSPLIVNGALPYFPLFPYNTIETKTSFLPHFTNKTTSVASKNNILSQPHYLIKNEVMRSKMRVQPFTTEVVLLLELGRNEVDTTKYSINNQYSIINIQKSKIKNQK